ncbi:MAG TPA: STAS/SEC14 domain-containing protein [Terriglobales bacterium]|nr:STAS/SEC14 domain-containing protein [Terriglobales bacterium]
MERVRFVPHAGKEILFVDCSRCKPGELIDIFDTVEDIVTKKPPHSVLVLSDFEGAELDREAITRMKEVAVMDRPHVRRSAFVGTQDLPRVYHKALETFSVREFPAFKTREEALEWLVED